LAYTRFSGKKAAKFEAKVLNIPLEVMQECYSHELFSVGFWLGNDIYPKPTFYAYCYPNLPDFKSETIGPAEASWNNELGEFLLNYEVVQNSADQSDCIQRFLQTTYEAAAKVANWDRESLDCDFTHLN
jgi:hypothetical protein